MLPTDINLMGIEKFQRECERKDAELQRDGSELSPTHGSAPRVAVTQDLVDAIIKRAKASHWGLGLNKAPTDIGQYAEPNTDALALLMVNGWEEKYDMVSLFAAAVDVIQEKGYNLYAGEK